MKIIANDIQINSEILPFEFSKNYIGHLFANFEATS